MIMKHYLLVFLFLPFCYWGQTGGMNAFQNLNTCYNARNIGLGGDIITLRDGDLNLGLSNPAMLNSEMINKGTISQTLLSGGINTGGLTYCNKIGNTIGLAHFRYINYGKMKRTDINGTDLGTFTPGDFIVGASALKKINERMFVGATFNFLYSQLDSYTTFGNSLDIGGTYLNPDKRLVFSGVIKNLGVQWKGYNHKRNPLPLEIQLGVSHKLEHAPFRFSFVAQNLQKWDLSYNDPSAKDKVDPLTGDTIFVKKAGVIEKIARHALIQTELLFGPKFHLRIGFDYQRRREMGLTNRPGLAGFSFGTGLYFKRFTLDYGWLIYSAAGYQHALSITIPINSKGSH
jgi:hypothetical protein